MFCFITQHLSLTTFGTETSTYFLEPFFMIWNEAMQCKHSFSINLPSDTEVRHELECNMLIALDTAPLFYHTPLLFHFVPTFLLRSSFLSSFYPAFRDFRSLPPSSLTSTFLFTITQSLDCLRLSRSSPSLWHLKTLSFKPKAWPRPGLIHFARSRRGQAREFSRARNGQGS